MSDKQTDPTNADAPRERPDALVVGAGLAGLAVAIDLARAGRSVLVLDARAEIGGRARTATHDGFLLNEGPHALYRTGEAWAFLEREGLTPAGDQPASDRAVGVMGDLVAPLPAGPMSLLRTPLLRGERLRFGRMFAGLNRLDVRGLDDVTVADGVHRLVGDGQGAAIVHALLRVATYGNDPESMALGPAIEQLRQSLATPVRYVDGGWGSIVASLEQRLLELGGRIRTGAKVTTVVEQGSGVDVHVGDERLSADAVVLAAGGPRQVESMTGVDPAPHARPSTAATLDVGFAASWGDHPTFGVGLDEPLYLSLHAPTADLAPAGGCLVSVMRYHPFGEAPDPDRDRAVMEAMLDRVRPGWRVDADRVVFRARQVAAYDQPSADRGGLAGRAGGHLPGHERVLLAGDWIGPSGLLADAVFASAGVAAKAAARVSA